MIDQNRRSGLQKIGLIKTFSRVYPKKGEHAHVGWKEKSPIPREIYEFSVQGILQPTTEEDEYISMKYRRKDEYLGLRVKGALQLLVNRYG